MTTDVRARPAALFWQLPSTAMDPSLAVGASSASTHEFPHVFAPLRLRHRTLSARITFGAHTANMAEGGLPGERHIGYYVERALGGAGMIVVEPVPTHRTAVLTRGNFRHGDDAVVPHFRRLTEAVHEAAETTIIQQLYHVGQHGDAENSFAPNWSPSGLPSYHDADGSHAMTEAEIEELLDGFVAAACRAQQSGFDGVEVFAAYHAVIDQFWTPWSNRRTDRWGSGSLENRLRFGREILERVRRACGDEFIVGLAVSVDPESPASLGLAEMQEIVAWHDERELMDYVTCGTGSYFDFYKLIPTSLYPGRYGEPFAAALKEVVRHAAVQAESHMRTPANAEAALAAGHADLVSIVRGQIADPHLVRKAREGRAAAVRPCISCNQMCWGRRSRDYFISCLVNPSAGREFEYGGDRFTPVEPAARKRVVVVGGGPAGMEAARVAAERGHGVRLFESAEQLGGQWRLAGRQPSREQILDHIAWYERELERLDVDIRLNTPFIRRPRHGRTRSSLPPAPTPHAMAFNAQFRSPIACRASMRGTSQTSPTCCHSPGNPAGGSRSSTISTIGAASALLCSSRTAAATSRSRRRSRSSAAGSSTVPPTCRPAPDSPRAAAG